MPVTTVRTPAYRLYKPAGQAVVTLSGRDYYFGSHGTSSSRTEYDRCAGSAAIGTNGVAR